ncbi:MAG: type II toxin-antitoxin system RatA family toxin [Xanthomonadales bacterium]|nr:type II toxin-antitoxin system RatA family toxin [Xanthomonadales bacterium]
MIEIRRQALVPYTPEQMFDLVNDVEAYPSRFSWCSAARVVERQGDAELTARLDLSLAGIRHGFTTRNTLERPRHLRVRLVEGPLKTLDGDWHFDALGDTGCRVRLALDFEVSGRLTGAALRLGFQVLASRMVDDFCVAARKTYG